MGQEGEGERRKEGSCGSQVALPDIKIPMAEELNQRVDDLIGEIQGSKVSKC